MNGNEFGFTPLISIIINCYNSEKHLSQTIDSVINQTYKNWEIIFWDNISTDNSADIVKRYEDSRIKYFLASIHTNLGEARNLAVNESSGSWIAFLDCDDIWVNNKLEIQVNQILSEPDAGLFYSKADFFTSDNTKYGSIMPDSLPSGNIFLKLVKENFIVLSTAIIRKDVFYKVGKINNTLCQAEDYDLFIKISHKFKVISHQKALCYYRVHNNNLSNFQKEEAFIESLKILEMYIDENGVRDGIVQWQALYQIYKIKSMKIRLNDFKWFLSLPFLVKFANLSFKLLKSKHLT
jgi:glycosyltransferase involved in cell wall biosynthesis